MNITKRFYFEAAHRLMHNKGKCKNIHGHNYVVDVAIHNLGINEKTGITVDFNNLKFIKDWIDDCLDHAILLNFDDKPIIRLCQKYEYKWCGFSGDPTAENIAIVIKDFLIANDTYCDTGELTPDLAAEVISDLYTVTVYENKDCWVTE